MINKSVWIQKLNPILIVAYNVSKNVSSLDLRNWLSQKGIHVKGCTLLTTFDEARSLSYKITLDPKDFDIATQDASIWPYRVGVRLFKTFKNSQNAYQNTYGGNVRMPVQGSSNDYGTGRYGHRNQYQGHQNNNRYINNRRY